jgi:hypothetical protein
MTKQFSRFMKNSIKTNTARCYSNFFKAEKVVQVLNILGYSVVLLG